ncbi:unnamed protein product [Leptidea sinapis]|uniref:Peptidase M14 domain-containing protein n=1 Tax=Leptidea sinapis TaxID=189913 RepID=A0A5E4Q9W4_9NEOP|nr:unnamed protein product [Leptidea sinapis]
MEVKLFCTILIIFVQQSICKQQYNGYTVYGVTLRDQNDIEFIRNLEAELSLDLWQTGMVGIRDAYLMVKPEYGDHFKQRLDERGMKHYLHVDNVQRSLDKFERDFTNWKRRRESTAIYNTYARYDEIDAYMERLGSEYPDLVTVVNAGPSFDGRPVKYVKISTTNFMDTSKPIYFMDAAMHSREWVTPPVALYSMHRLVEDLREEDRDLLENIDWIIMPVANPDGYEYSHTDDRMWRRSRSFNATVSTVCYGADINRNFDFEFGTVSVSSDPCSQIYPGPYPFSEIETRYLSNIMNEYLDRMEIYQNIHSYGSYILYGFDNETLPANVAQIHLVGAAMGAKIDALKMSDAVYYAVGNSNFVLYPASGTAQDYAQDKGIPFVYTLELPDFGRYDFLVPPEYIEQINTETWAGLAETARLARLFYRDRS